MTVKSRLLEILEQHKGDVLSGEALAGELNCTRAAIWKAVKSLREEGYTIMAGPNKGYMLSVNSNRLSAEAIRLHLKNPSAGVMVYRELDSTNQEARRIIVSGEAEHGLLVLAQSQSQGRGRRGRSFFSPEDAGLYMSIVLQPGRTLKDSLLLTTAAAAAVYKAVKKVCGICLDIKWVNDLYYKGKKVCGILTEAVTDFESGDIEFAIVGIGLNLFVNKDGMPAEICDVAGGLYSSVEEAEGADRNLLAAEIVNVLLEETRELKISNVYIERNIVPGKKICITDGGEERFALALSVCSDGRLRVREEDGTETMLSYGEVAISPEDMF